MDELLYADRYPPGANPERRPEFASRRYNVRYTLNNPVKYTDPSGHSVCLDINCSIVGNPVSGELIQRGPGASYWNQSGMELVRDWYFEQGPETRYYGPSAPLTKDLMNDEGVHTARKIFYSTDKTIYGYPFNSPEQPLREGIQWITGEDQTGVGSVLGTYNAEINDNGDGTITFWVRNMTGRESGSRLLGNGPILETAPAGYLPQLYQGINGVINGTTSFESLRDVWPVSVFEDKTREQTESLSLPWVGSNGWGGNMTQSYMWSEPLCSDCRN